MGWGVGVTTLLTLPLTQCDGDGDKEVLEHVVTCHEVVRLSDEEREEDDACVMDADEEEWMLRVCAALRDTRVERVPHKLRVCDELILVVNVTEGDGLRDGDMETEGEEEGEEEGVPLCDAHAEDELERAVLSLDVVHCEKDDMKEREGKEVTEVPDEVVVEGDGEMERDEREEGVVLSDAVSLPLPWEEGVVLSEDIPLPLPREEGVMLSEDIPLPLPWEEGVVLSVAPLLPLPYPHEGEGSRVTPAVSVAAPREEEGGGDVEMEAWSLSDARREGE